MFFILSKTIGLLETPHYLALLAILIGLALRLARRLPRLRRGLFIFAVAVLWVFSTGAVATLLLAPLETRYARPDQLAKPPAAIVMLTGLTDHMRMGPRYGYELTEASDRFVEAVRLARKYPEARLLITGGSSELVDTRYREARTLGWLARELGVPERQLLIEDQARNTRENATFSVRMLRDKGITGPVLLVTSAYHMPRSVGCFRKAGLEAIPWPVDYLRSGYGPGAWIPKPGSLGRSAVALHEYFGWLSYKISGYL